MKKFLNKAKSAFDEFQDSPSSSSQRAQQRVQQVNQRSTIGPPTPIDLIRYRYHHGTNLGSIFVLEKWLHGSMFPEGCSGGSELDAVSTSLKKNGLETTRQKWENHWRNACSDQDFEWLVKEARCTSIRLPIGFFTLGAEWCRGTAFDRVAEVYANAWGAVREFVGRARGWGIGTLIDFHGLPGGANKEDHSGTTSGKAELWGNGRNLEMGKEALGWIAREVRHGGLDGVVGIQVVNESVWDAKGMYSWYENVIGEIGGVDESIPVYISDAWDLERALEWVNGRHAFSGLPKNLVVVDTHRYFTFAEKYRSQSPQEIIGMIGGQFGELDGKEGAIGEKGEAQIIVGEWSCVLDGRTWGRARKEEKDGLVKQFGEVQSQKWQQRAGGSYFWTYKMDWMNGGEWGFKEQTKKGNIPPPPYLTLPAQEVRSRAQHAQGMRAEMAHGARSSHENYWNNAVPGKQFEHHLYSEGWDVGFSDAQKFFTMRADGALGDKVAGEGGDKIGCLEIWVKKRLLESGQRGEFVWEWEQGFRAGVGAFYDCVGM